MQVCVGLVNLEHLATMATMPPHGSPFCTGIVDSVPTLVRRNIFSLSLLPLSCTKLVLLLVTSTTIFFMHHGYMMFANSRRNTALPFSSWFELRMLDRTKLCRSSHATTTVSERLNLSINIIYDRPCILTRRSAKAVISIHFACRFQGRCEVVFESDYFTAVR